MALLTELGRYMQSDAPEWRAAQDLAARKNGWFTPESIQLAAQNIASFYLQQAVLQDWIAGYQIPQNPQTVGMVMAGNIPLVGFHDFLCGFVTGHTLQIKLSTKDDVLLPHLVDYMRRLDPEELARVQFVERLQDCDAFIATGSNNSARYFEQYFGHRPHLIRQSRTSVAVLDGDETPEALEALSRDVYDYFGLGCRNITQVAVPEGYDLTRLLQALNGPTHITQHHKFRNNYDYHLALFLLNKVPYQLNDNLILVQNEIPFSAVATLHYRFYTDRAALIAELKADDRIQTIVGRGEVPFGSAQTPGLCDYADGADTMAFLCSLGA